MARRPQQSFYEVLTDAVNDIATHGYDSAERLEAWLEKLRRAAYTSMISEDRLAEMLRDALRSKYRNLVDRGGLLRSHAIEKFTLARIAPKLRAELDRRILASANLIKLNRQEAIEQTLRRFSGWTTSVPAGGSPIIDRRDTKTKVRKALASLPFEERRVLIDQGHKLVAAIHDIVASDGGALAAVWHSHWREKNYNYREDHKERDEKVYAMKPNWAFNAGLMKAGPAGLYSSITKPAEEVFCRCYARYIYGLGSLPDDMLTVKGRDELKRVKMELKSAA